MATILALGTVMLDSFGLSDIRTETLFEIVKFTMWEPLAIPAISKVILIFPVDLILILSHALGKILLTYTDISSDKGIEKATLEA
ncbi:uncharacterized protein N7496_008859 [Penicillium cataractarum]|uniref:Uncharacterized protein n=1 Tax=Penicillium cataractarum TaxID=2100454 RepID=A0A9W9V644_9EURO|nr:uncharacterized protein N7496_008859 [Penicillium cataractarum]KAJ5369099.1 hypothetical protein N7496_008859 [Penicillium cataractarum]